MSKSASLAVLAAMLYATAMFLVNYGPAFGDVYLQQSTSPTQYASSTAITLSWGRSISVLATSTRTEATGTLPATAGRTGVSIDAINCQPNSQVFISFNDVPAATSTGKWLAASSSITISGTIPNVYGSIRALASSGNCTLLVNEFRTIN